MNYRLNRSLEILNRLLLRLVVYPIIYHKNLRAPPQCHPPQRVKAFLGGSRDNDGLQNPLNKAGYFLGGNVALGGYTTLRFTFYKVFYLLAISPDFWTKNQQYPPRSMGGNKKSSAWLVQFFFGYICPFSELSILKKNQPKPKMYLERNVGIQASKSLPIVTVVTRFITVAWILASLAKIEFLCSLRDVGMDLSCMSICIPVKRWVYRHTSGSLGLRCFCLAL